MDSDYSGVRVMEDRINPEIFQEFHDLLEEIADELNFESSDDIRKELVVMARSGTVESYRQIEKITKDTSLSAKEHDFAIVALNFCIFKIENYLLGLKADMVSGGLGGKDNRLRYYVAFTGKEGLMENACKEIEKVFGGILCKYDSILEEVNYHGYYVSLLILGSIDHAIGVVLDEAISGCGILSSEYYLTNVEIPSDERIRDWLDGKLDESS